MDNPFHRDPTPFNGDFATFGKRHAERVREASSEGELWAIIDADQKVLDIMLKEKRAWRFRLREIQDEVWSKFQALAAG